MDHSTTTEAETPESETPTEDELTTGQEEEVKRLKRRIFWKHSAFNVADMGLLVGQIVTAFLTLIPIGTFLLSFIFGFGFITILSGSMSGTIETRDLVIMQQYHGQELAVGQIVGVEAEQGRYVHRITEVHEDGTYTTKGDANPKADYFKPTADDFWGIPVAIQHQPTATALTMFSLDATWIGDMGTAISSGNWDAVGALIPAAPWGVVLLLILWFVFFWLIPDLIAYLQRKAQARDELAWELMKRQVATHEESLTEIEPVVEEIKEERAKKEADEAAFKEAQAKAWDEFDPTAPIYDEPEEVESNPFVDAYEQEDDALPEPFAIVDDPEAFLRELQQRHNTVGVTTRSSVGALPDLDASTPDAYKPQHTLASSAFYLEEED